MPLLPTRRAGRGPPSRGTTALEVAMVMPLFLLVIGFSLTLSFAGMARFLMMDYVHNAVRYCVDFEGTRVMRISMSSCITDQVNTMRANTFTVPVCNMSSPVVSGPTPVGNIAWPPTYNVSVEMTCSFVNGGWLVDVMPALQGAFTVRARDVTTFIPRYPL